MPYAQAPFLNISYEPEKTDIRRLLDTQEKIKKEKQADQSFEQDLANAQQAYELGAMKIKEAQMKTDEIMRAKQLDDDSSKMYQSVIMSGGTEADAFRATKALRAKNGGWAQMQQDMEAEHEMLTKAMSMAKLSPALAEKAASLINSNLSPGSPMMTGAQLYEMQNRKDPVKLDDKGNFIMWEFDQETGKSVPVIKSYQSQQMMEAEALEQKNKEREYRIKESQVGAEYARVRGGLTEAAMRSEDTRLRAETDVKVALINKEKVIEGAEKKGEYTRDIQELKGVQKLDQIAAKGGVDLTLVEARGEINKAMQEEKLKMQDKWKGLDVAQKAEGQKILQEHYKATEALGKDTLELKRLIEKNDVKENDRIFELKQTVQKHRMKMDEKSYELDKYVAESNKANQEAKLTAAAEANKERFQIMRDRTAAIIKNQKGSAPVSAEGKGVQAQAEKLANRLLDVREKVATMKSAKPTVRDAFIRSLGRVPATGPDKEAIDTMKIEAYAKEVEDTTKRAFEELSQYNSMYAASLMNIHFNSAGKEPGGTASGTSARYNASWMQGK